jgi:hypothetical protein
MGIFTKSVVRDVARKNIEKDSRMNVLKTSENKFFSSLSLLWSSPKNSEVNLMKLEFVKPEIEEASSESKFLTIMSFLIFFFCYSCFFFFKIICKFFFFFC